MIVAIPIDPMMRVYHKNPSTSHQFALYEINGNREDVRYRHIETKLNPWAKWNGEMACNPQMKECDCNAVMVQDPQHICEHYVLLQVIGKSDYLIVDKYCLNTLYAMRNVGIKIHKIPPFTKTVEEAINHFIIGAQIANHLQHIHPAS